MVQVTVASEVACGEEFPFPPWKAQHITLKFGPASSLLFVLIFLVTCTHPQRGDNKFWVEVTKVAL